MTAICSFFSNFVRLNCRWMKPILKYRGGKSKELSMLLPYVPAFAGRYIEPFMGGGAMFFHLELPNSIINDINGR